MTVPTIAPEPPVLSGGVALLGVALLGVALLGGALLGGAVGSIAWTSGAGQYFSTVARYSCMEHRDPSTPAAT